MRWSLAGVIAAAGCMAVSQAQAQEQAANADAGGP